MNSLFYTFFGSMINHIEQEKTRQRNKEAGIESDEKGMYGVPSKNIPFKYDSINFINNFYRSELCKKTTVYDKNGSFLFTVVKFIDLTQGMFLVKHEEESNYCLYRGYEKLSEPIFKDWGIGNPKFEADYCVLRFQDGDESGECIINKEGEFVMEQIGSYFSYNYRVINNIAVHKDTYYNLHTGNVICYCNSYDKPIKVDDNLLIVQMTTKGYSNHYRGNAACIINTITGDYTIMGNPPKEEPVAPKPKEQTKIQDEEKPKSKPQQRNDLCSCGSGKKFKNCCLNK